MYTNPFCALFPGKISFLVLLIFLSVCPRACGMPEDIPEDPPGDPVYPGLTLLSQTRLDQIDGLVSEYSGEYGYISLGIIMQGEPVLERYYGRDHSSKREVYASVSKPVTSIICFEFLEQGLIHSLDDPISEYSKKYRDVLPLEYEGHKITFTHLLTHRSGIPHHERIWKKGKLDLQFAPGEEFLYSTRGYGVLGAVLSEIGGMSYNRLVKTYVGEPVDAGSMAAPLPFFEAPGGLVRSTLGDMLLFAGGVMNSAYVKDSLLYQLAWKSPAADPGGDMGLGWYLYKQGTDDLAAYHAGSNGKPRAFLVLKPYKKMAVVLLGKQHHADGKQHFQELASRIVDLLLQFE
jgi:CubicO group peptidase (beta-lactamase class C family)